MNTARTETARSRYSLTATGFLIPPLVWAGYFYINYTLQGIACGTHLQHMEWFGINLASLILAVILLFAIGIVLTAGIRAWHGWRRLSRANGDTGSHSNRALFMSYLSLLLAGLFLLSLVWIGVPVLLLDPCAVTLPLS